MKKILTTVALAATLATAAHAQNIAIVNGKPVPSSRLDAAVASVLARNPGGEITPEQKTELRKNISDQLIKQEILAQEAQKQGIENTAAYKNAMDLARQSALVNLLVEDFAKKNKPSDAESKAEYDRAVAEAQKQGGKEYKARHILVENEKQAKDLIAQINKGAKFDTLAKKYSKDPGSGAQGGELGWADPAGYVPEFSAALKALEKGKMTQMPVKSSFGYHIIKLDDIREAQKPAIPPYEQVKDRVSQNLLSQKIQAFESSLREKASVK